MLRRLRLAALLLICVAPPAPAEPESPAALAERLLEDQQIGFELEAIRERALAELADRQRVVRPADRSRLQAVVGLGFDGDATLRYAKRELVAGLDPTRARRAARWLADPEHRELYRRGQGADARCLAALELSELAASITPERGALVLRVAQGTGAAGRSVRQGARVFAAMLVAANEALPAERRFSAEQVLLLVEAQRAALADRHPTDLRALHCAYHGISSEVLRRAAAFFASPAGRWMRSATDAAVERALTQAAVDTARYIVDAFGAAPPAAALQLALD